MHLLRPLHAQDEEIAGRYLKFIRQVSSASDPVSVFLFANILKANHQLIQASGKNLSSAGLSWAKFRLLLELQRDETLGPSKGLEPSVLSERQDVSRNTVSALIAALEQERLISRELHGTDRRKFVIRLTPKGRKVIHSRLDRQFKLITRCFAGLSASERDTLLAFLTRLNRELSDNPKSQE